MKTFKNIQLTKYSPGAGWACKISSEDLTQVLSKLKINTFKNTKGYENFDDCGIYKLNNKQSIIQTVDFFTPIVDDPYFFGQIAAANSLSDIYAMGGKPLFALNIAAFPTEKLDLDILSKILEGGADKCNEANIPILGGHTIKDDIPKYGLAVTGIIDNNKIILNSTAKADDDIILTKPIGSGIISTAIKKGLASSKTIKSTIDIMNTLNEYASDKMYKYKINACTDITGYGLLGHLNEMCKGSKLTAKISFEKVSLIDEVVTFAKKNIIPGGTKKNLDFNKKDIDFSNNYAEYQKYILADAQTSGGLLMSCPKENSEILIKSLNKNSKYKSKIIGEFTNKQNCNIICN